MHCDKMLWCDEFYACHLILTMRTSIHLIEFKRIHQAGDEGFLIVRIACAVNDLISGNYFCRIAERLKADPKTKDTGRGLSHFGVNSQIGHLSEAMLLILNPRSEESTLDSTPKIKAYVKLMTPTAQQSCRLLRGLLPGNKDHAHFRKYVENFRNQVSFHYDDGISLRSWKATRGSHC